MSATPLLIGTVVCATPYVALLVAPAACRRVMYLAWREDWQRPWTDYLCRGLTLLGLFMSFACGGFMLIAMANGFGLHNDTAEGLAATIGGMLGVYLLMRLAKAAGIH